MMSTISNCMTGRTNVKLSDKKNSKNTSWHIRPRGKQNTQQPTENSVGDGGGGTKRQEAIGTKWMV
jgi:hypothetical protein